MVDFGLIKIICVIFAVTFTAATIHATWKKTQSRNWLIFSWIIVLANVFMIVHWIFGLDKPFYFG